MDPGAKFQFGLLAKGRTATFKNAIKGIQKEIVLVNVIAIFLGSVLVLAWQTVAGRLVGLGVTAVCSAAIAFFLMPPVYSLRVSQTSDLVALILYGTVGLVVAKSAPSRTRRAVIREGPIQYITPLKPPESDVRAAMSELMSSDLGVQLRAADIAVDVASVGLPCPHGDALRILNDVFSMALRDSEIRRISVYGGKQPGIQRLVIAAHRSWPPPLYEAVTIGRRDEDCEPVAFPGWPSHSRATWFDNGYLEVPL